MSARGVLSLYTAQLPVQKTLATNSRISITSKLIRIKGLQVLYSSHLRKTGGRGSYRLVHIVLLAVQRGLAAKPRYSRTYGNPGERGYTGFLVGPIRRPLPKLLYLIYFLYLRGQTNVTAAGGRRVLQRYFSLRGAAARIAASNCWAWSKGRERRNRSARRAWAYFS